MDTHEKATEVADELKHMTQELRAMKKHAAHDLKGRAPKTRVRRVALPTIEVPVIELQGRSRRTRARRKSGGGRSLRWFLVVGIVGVIAAVAVRFRRRAALAPLISGDDMALKGGPAAAPKDGQVHQMAPVPDGGDAPAARR